MAENGADAMGYGKVLPPDQRITLHSNLASYNPEHLASYNPEHHHVQNMSGGMGIVLVNVCERVRAITTPWYCEYLTGCISTVGDSISTKFGKNIVTLCNIKETNLAMVSF